MTDHNEPACGETEPLPTMAVLADPDDLGWAIAARRQEEAERIDAQAERVRCIIRDLTPDSDERALVLALDRIGDVLGMPASAATTALSEEADRG